LKQGTSDGEFGSIAHKKLPQLNMNIDYRLSKFRRKTYKYLPLIGFILGVILGLVIFSNIVRAGIYTEPHIVSVYAASHYNGFTIGFDHYMPFGSFHTKYHCIGSCDY
jgi:hypothetical protein